MHTFALGDGVNLSYLTAGIGRPLLLLHGFTGSAMSWRLQMGDLAGRFRIVALDLLGHGHSDAPADSTRYRMETCVADLADFIHALNLVGCVVVGYSMGGRVALALAIEHPELVSGLILESASPGLQSSVERATRHRADEELAAYIDTAGLARFVDRWEALPMWASQASLTDAARNTLREDRLKCNPIGLAASLRGLGTGIQPSYWERLGEVHVPALIIAGQLDNKYADIAAAMYLGLPGGELAIVSEAGHTVHLEKPEVFNRLVIEFVEKEREE